MPNAPEPGSKLVVPIAVGLTDWLSALAMVNSSVFAPGVPGR
jgi:hypothetical protein